MKRKLAKTVAAFALSLMATDAFAYANGVAVTALPEPDGSGAYVFGDSGYATVDYTDKFAAGVVYPAWETLNVPAGSTVEFAGGVALSSLPEGCTCDFSGCTFAFVMSPSVLGSAFSIPSGVHVLFQPATARIAGDVVSFANAGGAMTLDASLDVAGAGDVWVGRNNDVVFNGPVTGLEDATITVQGFGRRATFNGALDFGGVVKTGTSQRNACVIVNSPAAESRIGKFEGHDWGNERIDQTHGAPEQLIYTPASAGACTLVISNFDQHETGGLLEPEETGHFKYRRWGVILATCSNNTICVSNVVRHGAVHVMACSNGAYTFGDEPAFDEGFGNFEFVNLGNNNGYADRRAVFYPSPNVNLRFTGRFTGARQEISPSFDYTAESNTVNRGSLDMSQAESSAQAHPPVRITGYSPWNLPRSIKVHANLAATTTNIVTGSRWLMPLDFAAAAADISVARCESDAILLVPSAGTVVASNATAGAGWRISTGKYPVITGSAVVNDAGATGAAAFANWTIERAGRWGGYVVQLEGADDGLWMVVKISGTEIIIR